jgi:type IV pilus assembly protein PilC
VNRSCSRWKRAAFSADGDFEVDVGEETGQLPEMLMKIAEVYDDEVDNAVEGLTSLLEPIMIVILALIVGTIVIALFMP